MTGYEVTTAELGQLNSFMKEASSQAIDADFSNLIKVQKLKGKIYRIMRRTGKSTQEVFVLFERHLQD